MKNLFKNYDQFKVAVSAIVKNLLKHNTTIVIKHITVERINIPQQSQTALEALDTDSEYTHFYNSTRRQFEVWRDGNYIRRLG